MTITTTRAAALRPGQRFKTRLTGRTGLVEDIRKVLDHDYVPIVAPSVFLIGAGRKTLHPNVIVDVVVDEER